MSDQLKVVPTGAALGADIEGVDLRDIDDAVFAKILDGWHENLILRFRGQDLDDDSLAEFSCRFGELDMAPTGRGGTPFDPTRPEITVLSNIVVNGEAVGALGNSELVWHQDMTYNDLPPKASLLYAMEVPEAGGDTSFYNMYKAYETLPDDLRARIQGLSCKHDATRTSSGELRHGYDETYNHEDRPGAVHPFVIRHPATDKPALFLGRRPNAYVPGLPEDEGDALLDALWDHINSGLHSWTQQWRAGDLVIWDNRCALHRRNGLDPNMRRLMHRTQVRDEARPVAAWAS
ncbi:MAG: TauD/TfdA family dioxygenase [Alphaproteobacteria bacterium]|nr:TauD/TfdA family dioxygenase [Alphaproteobacteria bacterium]